MVAVLLLGLQLIYHLLCGFHLVLQQLKLARTRQAIWRFLVEIDEIPSWLSGSDFFGQLRFQSGEDPCKFIQFLSR